MNEETIKKLIQLTEEQQGLLALVNSALSALCESGVRLMWDDEDSEIFAINMNNFKHKEIGNTCEREYYLENGYVEVPYWEGEKLFDCVSGMWPDDRYFAIPKRADNNLFNQ